MISACGLQCDQCNCLGKICQGCYNIRGQTFSVKNHDYSDPTALKLQTTLKLRLTGRWVNKDYMQVDIAKASLNEKSLIQHMMQLYQYDFSEFEGTDLDDQGLFSYKYLDLYWVEENRTPLIVRVTGRLAGFVLVNKHSYTKEDRFCIAEFFIMRKYRRKGIGKEVTYRVFDMFDPLWEVQQTKQNIVAQAFWIKVVNEYTNGDFELYETGLGDWKGPIQTFKSRSKP